MITYLKRKLSRSHNTDFTVNLQSGFIPIPPHAKDIINLGFALMINQNTDIDNVNIDICSQHDTIFMFNRSIMHINKGTTNHYDILHVDSKEHDPHSFNVFDANEYGQHHNIIKSKILEKVYKQRSMAET
jgi:hypothetical protein